MKGLRFLSSLALSAMLLITPNAMLAETSQDEYLYGYTSMSFADFWYGEIEQPKACDTFDLNQPDLTAQSETYLHYASSSAEDVDRYAGVQKNTWDNDSGEYDAISRATVGYGLFRAGFAHTVEVTLDDGSKAVFSSEIVEDASSPTGFTLHVNENDVPGIVLADNTRLDIEATTGYTPDTNTTYANSIQNGGGYQITGLKSVPVKVKKATVEAAKALTEAGENNAQLEAFNAKAAQITFVDEMTAYACKELYASGVYSARETNENAAVRDAGSAYLGDGSNGTKAVAHGDGYADLTLFVYLDAYDGYTRGSLLSLDEAALDSLYVDEETPTYAANKDAADRLAGFMDYALHYQGAKLQWAGADGSFDTADDVIVGNMLHKDSYFSFNHGNYIEVSITTDFERFQNLGNGDYRITLISEGYADVTVTAENLLLDYRTPAVIDENVPALAQGENTLSVALDISSVKVSLDAAVQDAYAAGLGDAANYSLSYTEGSGRQAATVNVCESAEAVAIENGVCTVTFAIADASALPQDIHYQVGIASAAADVSDVTVDIHYAPTEAAQ